MYSVIIKIKQQISFVFNTGRPKFVVKSHHELAFVNTYHTITCRLCQSNPASKITWLYNGTPLDSNKNNIQITWCEESLYFQVSSEKEGNYTCLAENDIGENRWVTQLEVVGMVKVLILQFHTY